MARPGLAKPLSKPGKPAGGCFTSGRLNFLKPSGSPQQRWLTMRRLVAGREALLPEATANADLRDLVCYEAGHTNRVVSSYHPPAHCLSKSANAVCAWLKGISSE